MTTNQPNLDDLIRAEQRAYAAAILAYRLAQQHAERVGEVYAQAVHMAEVLRGRMEQARRELPSDRGDC